jgi:methionyl-tRNA formyltransferase
VTALRVLFAGTPEVALPALDLLVDDERFDVVAVLTNPDRPRGRSGRPVPSPVALRGLALGLPVLRPVRPVDDIERIVATGAEVGAVVAYGSLLPERLLAALPLGFVNLHFSVLPRWRGAAPVQHAIRAGDATTGATVFRLDRGMDTGPVLRSMERPVPEDVEAGELLGLLSQEGAPLLADGLLALAAGEEPRAQREEGVTFAPRLDTSDGAIDWSLGADVVARIVRSVTPRPGAHTSLGPDRVKVAGVRVVPVPAQEGSSAPAPGTVHADTDGIAVACGDGAIRIDRIQFPGRPWASTADQVRGRRLATGMVLGGPGRPT